MNEYLVQYYYEDMECEMIVSAISRLTAVNEVLELLANSDINADDINIVNIARV